MNNPRAVVGANNPPVEDPIDAALVPFAEVLDEAAQWLDGTKVTTEGQMKCVDALIKGMKAARKAVDDARDVVTKPLHETWKGEIARWKPTQDDLDMQVKGLVALVDVFKRELAAEKARIAREAWDRADADRKAAEALVARADVSDIDAQREATAAMQAADLARAQATVASKDTVKGMRTVHRYEITDHRAALHWIAANDRDAVTAFIDAYVAKNHKDTAMGGVRNWTEKEAF